MHRCRGVKCDVRLAWTEVTEQQGPLSQPETMRKYRNRYASYDINIFERFRAAF